MDFSPIRLLDDSVARKIAAGEVIERPASVLRELLDNAIDAGSTSISVFLEGGGSDRLRVIDDGHGMTRSDLELCYRSHATSKITTEHDFDHVTTLGFRGEALSSVATCSHLTIVSGREGKVHRLQVTDGKFISLEPWQGGAGSIIDVSRLFHSFPARKRFLKRASSEGMLCRKTFIEKSWPFPSIAFRLFSEGDLKLFLPAASQEERINQTLKKGDLPLQRVDRKGEEFSFSLFFCPPDIYEKTRKQIQIYANHRRIEEYALVQAIQYGFDAYLAGGLFPLCFLFLRVHPTLIDFNVHPAKKEARFRNLPAIHHAIVTALRDSLSAWDRNRRGTPSSSLSPRRGNPALSSPPLHYPKTSATSFSASVAERPAPRGEWHRLLSEAERGSLSPPEETTSSSLSFRYLGQAMGLFLLVERAGLLYVVDQHAAHERVLYESLCKETPLQKQDLLIPLEIHLEEDEVGHWRQHREALKAMGIETREKTSSLWEILSLPTAALDYTKDLIAFLKESVRLGQAFHQKNLFATIACHSSIKEGEAIDETTALSLLEATFALSTSRCPHGRPLWHVFTKDDLSRLVGRLS